MEDSVMVNLEVPCITILAVLGVRFKCQGISI